MLCKKHKNILHKYWNPPHTRVYRIFVESLRQVLVSQVASLFPVITHHHRPTGGNYAQNRVGDLSSE